MEYFNHLISFILNLLLIFYLVVNLPFSGANAEVRVRNKKLSSILCILKEFELQHANVHIFCCLYSLTHSSLAGTALDMGGLGLCYGENGFLNMCCCFSTWAYI